MANGKEKRKVPRAKGSFVVSYRVLEDDGTLDFTQTKNIGQGGMMLTTNKEFPPGTKMVLQIRLPTDPSPMVLVGTVIESTKVIKRLIYDTRLEFLAVDEKHRKIISKTVDHFLKRKAK